MRAIGLVPSAGANLESPFLRPESATHYASAAGTRTQLQGTIHLPLEKRFLPNEPKTSLKTRGPLRKERIIFGESDNRLKMYLLPPPQFGSHILLGHRSSVLFKAFHLSNFSAEQRVPGPRFSLASC